MPFMGLVKEKTMDKTLEDYKQKVKDKLTKWGVKPEEADGFLKELDDDAQAPEAEAPEAGEAKGAEAPKAAEGEKETPEAKEGAEKAGEAPATDVQGAQDKPIQQAPLPRKSMTDEEITQKFSDFDSTIKGLQGKLEADEKIISTFGTKATAGGMAFGAASANEATDQATLEAESKRQKELEERAGKH